MSKELLKCHEWLSHLPLMLCIKSCGFSYSSCPASSVLRARIRGFFPSLSKAVQVWQFVQLDCAGWDVTFETPDGEYCLSHRTYLSVLLCNFNDSVWVARKPPGFAFIEFEDRRDADDAIRALNGTLRMGFFSPCVRV